MPTLITIEWTKHRGIEGYDHYTAWPEGRKVMAIYPLKYTAGIRIRYVLEIGGKRVMKGSVASCMNRAAALLAN